MPSNGIVINTEALIAIRTRSGYDGTALARLAKIDRAYYSRIESGQRTPSPEVAQRIALALKLPLVAILAQPSEVAS